MTESDVEKRRLPLGSLALGCFGLSALFFVAVMIIGGMRPARDAALDAEAKRQLGYAVQVEAFDRKYGVYNEEWSAMSGHRRSQHDWNGQKVVCAESAKRRGMKIDGVFVDEVEIGDNRWFEYVWKRAGC